MAMAAQQWEWQWWWRRSDGSIAMAMVELAQQWWWTEAIVEYDTIELYPTLFLSNKLISYVTFYVGPIQTDFLMTF